MRIIALFGRAAIVAATAAWHRPSAEPIAAGIQDHSTCAAVATESFCNAVVGLRASLRNPLTTIGRADVLPPPGIPGAVDPAITQASIDTTICRPGYARSVRPAFAVTEPINRRLMDAQHPGESFADYELDHLIPISLGGAPLDLRDLWLQPRRGRANAADKNALAYVLWRLVCERRVPLRTAQQATLWNSVVCFSNVGPQVEAAGKGDLVHVTGRVRESNHGEGNEVSYRTELIADTFSILTKAEADNS